MRLACLLLAAGGGTRFGGGKLLAMLDGKSLIRHSLEVLAPIFGEDLFVVLGAARDQLETLVAPPAQILVHADWQNGLGSSIARGIGVIRDSRQYDGVLIALADQVRLRGQDYRQLLTRFDGETIVTAYYAAQPGVPAVFPCGLFDRLQQLDGDQGARQILRDTTEQAVTVSLPLAERDIDTPGDLALEAGRET